MRALNVSRHIVFAMLVFCFVSFASVAKDGVLSGSKGKVHVHKTEYFDILYTDDSARSAEKIAEVCDSYYLEICSLLKTEPYQRFPVTITHQVESINAYYTAYPFNRIVLYDTYPGSLDMYEHTIESIFYHELTHAVTMNMKSPFFKKLSFFSDAANPAWGTLASFWVEGAAVYFESRKKTPEDFPHGRLNNPYSTLLVRQAKIDGNFPSWTDVTGARDTYPGGNDAYIFGSEFVKYLCDTYGEETYAKFWKESGKVLLFSSQIFKRVYKKDLNDVWKDFQKELKVPSVKNPENLPESKILLAKNKKNRFACFDSNKNGFAFYDKNSSAIKLSRYRNSSYEKPRKILKVLNLTSLSMNEDSSFLLLSKFTMKDNVKSEVVVYDLKKRLPFYVREDGLCEAAFTDETDGKLYFAAVKRLSGLYGVVKFSFDKKTRQIKKECEVSFGEDEIPYSLAKGSNGSVAMIFKKNLDFTIRIYDSTLAQYTQFILNKGDTQKLPVFHNLHSIKLDDGRIAFTFSYSALGKSGEMFPRCGILIDDKMTLLNEDVSGGIVDCFPLANFSGEKFSVGCVGEHYSFNEAYSFVLNAAPDANPDENLKLAVGRILAVKGGTLDDEKSSDFNDDENQGKSDDDFVKRSLSYNPFSYAFKGSILPLSNAAVYNHDLVKDAGLDLGLSYITTNPWLGKIFLVSGGYSLAYNCYGASAQLSGGNDSFSYALSANVAGDKKGFMQSAFSASAQKLIFYGLTSRFVGGVAADYFYGRQIIDDDFSDNVDETKLTYPRAQLYFQWTNRHKAGSGAYDFAGVTFTPFLLWSLRRSDYLGYDRRYLNPGLNVSVNVPFVLPLTFTASFFPSSSYFASGSVESVLFCHEIQKGIPYLNIYAYRFVVSAGYTGKIRYESSDVLEVKNTQKIIRNISRDDYSDELSLKAFFVGAPNFGSFASETFSFSLGGAFHYRFNRKEDEKRASFSLIMNISLF